MKTEDDAAEKDATLVRVFRFATEVHRTLTRELHENRTVVASAAILAFERLSPERQVEWCTTVREKHVTGTEG